MKKAILWILAGLMTFGFSLKANASARLDGLAADVREVEDMDLIWLYPNKVLQYKNTVDFKLADNANAFSNVNNEWGGVIASETDLGVIGVYVNRPVVMPSAWAPLTSSAYGWFNQTSLSWNAVGAGPFFFYPTDGNRSLDIFWADHLGSMDMGLHFTYGDGFAIFQASPVGGDAEDFGVGLGLGFTNLAGFSELNFHGDFQWQNITATSFISGNPTAHDAGIFTIKLGALGQADVTKDAFIRPFADLQIDSYDAGQLTAFFKESRSNWGLATGTSFNQKINGINGFVSTGLTLDYYEAKFTDFFFTGDYNESRYLIVWNASVESEVFKWLTIRAGLAANVFARVYNSDASLNTTWVDPTNNRVNFNTGFTLNWADFSLDCKVATLSLENAVQNPDLGGGIFYPSVNGNTGILMTDTVDMKFKF